MALNTQMSNNAVNTEADAVSALFNGGFIDVYDGTQPATADTAVAAQTKLVRLTFGNPAFASAVNGVLTANAITGGTALATGTASWFRVLQSNGTSAIMDGSVGTSAANLVLSTVSIVSGVTVNCSSFVHTVNKASAGI